MSKSTLGNCTKCGKPFTDAFTIWFLKGNAYHPKCIRENRDLLELWRATAWHQKEII